MVYIHRGTSSYKNNKLARWSFIATFEKTRTLVRAEGIITQLVFEHSLRIRVKAETSSSANTPAVSGAATPIHDGTPESTTTSERQSLFSPQETGDHDTLHSVSATTQSRDDTLRASTITAQSTASGGNVKKGGKSKKVEDPKTEPQSSAENLVGKINNLVTTDLGNITDSRDFLLVLIYIPVQITLCIVFLYAVLGWRCVAFSVLSFLYLTQL